MRVLVPSYGRAGHCSTMDALPCASIVVPENQREDYERCYPNRVITIPNEEDGHIAKKRNALLNLVEDGELFWMLDDDLLKAIRIKNGEDKNICELLESHFDAMESYGADYGGFGISSDPIKYAEYNPFSLTKPSYQAMCIRKIGVFYDEGLARHEDTDYFLKVVKAGGRILRDNRLFFEFECNKDVAKKKQVGGIEGNEDKHTEALTTLRKRWGNIIKFKDGKMNGIKPVKKGI